MAIEFTLGGVYEEPVTLVSLLWLLWLVFALFG